MNTTESRIYDTAYANKLVAEFLAGLCGQMTPRDLLDLALVALDQAGVAGAQPAIRVLCDLADQHRSS